MTRHYNPRKRILVTGGAGFLGSHLIDVERKGHVVANELEASVVVQVLDVALGAGEQVVDAYHLVAARQQPFATASSPTCWSASCRAHKLAAEVVIA